MTSERSKRRDLLAYNKKENIWPKYLTQFFVQQITWRFELELHRAAFRSC